MPEVTVITPCLNGEAYLEASLGSVLRQTYADLELIFVDDGSDDRSLIIAEVAAKRDSRVRIIRTRGRQGTAVARNLGVDAAKGRYIAFLDADDRWAPEKLERQLEFMQQRRAALCHTAYWVTNASGSSVSIRHAKANVTRHDLLYYNWIGCLTAVFDTQQLSKRYFVSRALNEDLVYWLDMLESGQTAVGLDVPLAYYRLSPSSKSRNKLRVALDRWRIYRKHLGMGLPTSFYYWICYCGLGLRRTVFTST